MRAVRINFFSREFNHPAKVQQLFFGNIVFKSAHRRVIDAYCRISFFLFLSEYSIGNFDRPTSVLMISNNNKIIIRYSIQPIYLMT